MSIIDTSITKLNISTPGIRTDEFRRRAANRVGFGLWGSGLVACLLACVYRLFVHHWPNIGWWGGFLLGGLLFRAGLAYQEIVGLLERQNALLERLLEHGE